MITGGSTQRSSASFNRRIVLDVIRRSTGIARKDIIDLVSLSPQTVANITQELEALGLITSKRIIGTKARGQPPISYVLNPDGGNAIGVSLEPRRISAALVNLVGEVLHHIERDIDVRDQELAFETIVEFVETLSRRSGDTSRIWGVGAALPGPWDVPSMSFVGPTAFEGWSDLSVLDRAAERTGLPVFHNTDSVAAALGESLFGGAEHVDNFYYMHFSIGLGGTLVLGRNVVAGDAGNATELGHIPIVPHGKPCYCGNYGCLERYFSLHSLAEFLGLEEGKELRRQEIQDLLRRDDVRLEEWCAQAAIHFRNAVCIIENMLDPATIIIGGPAPRDLLERLIALAMPLRPSVRGSVSNQGSRITVSALEEESSILGAAVLPIHEMLSPRLDLLQHEPKAKKGVGQILGNPTPGRARKNIG